MPSATLPPDLQHHYATINGIRMHYVSAGSGELVVFLHGFPEFWYVWRHQLAALAPHYRVIAPDLRGYNETENRGPYDTDTLQQDVLGLLEHLGESSAHMVGGDWGGAITWLLAINHPDAVRSLAVCNLPHPAIMRRAMRRSIRQLRRSWYMFAFQLPWLPQRALAFRRYQWLAHHVINDCRPGTFTREDVKAFLGAWRRQGLDGGVNWYRALFRRPPRLPKALPTIACPAVLIWGDEDQFLGKELTGGTEEYVTSLEVHHLPHISHWVQQEDPAEVNRILAEHLARASASG
jgi:epoxide hydrolase 4